jgi:creatinine amidohydrolase
LQSSPPVSTLNTSPEVASSAIDTAVIPLGSVEGKGPHLPVGTDYMLADAFAAAYAANVGAVYVLPAAPYATSGTQRGLRGTVYLDAETMWHSVVDTVGSLHRGGFTRFIILNMCSTNWTVKPTVRELNLRLRLGHTVWVEPKQFAYDLLRAENDGVDDRHGGAVDTALMMHCHPDCVGDPPQDHAPAVGREFVDYAGLLAICPDGVWGRPSLATPALGADLFAHMVGETTGYVATAFSKWREDEE